MTKLIKILFFGDIDGKIGRQAIIKELPKLKKKFKPDVVIANAENLAHGFGITAKTLTEMKEAGINYFTSGNHIFDKPEADTIFKSPDCPVIRPANYKKTVPGRGEIIINIGQKSLLVINLVGRVFIEEEFDNPFKTIDQILNQYKDRKFAGVLVDFHAEATSEKAALGHYLDGRISAVIGTHTHVQTADEKILKKGTAFITDAGMVGLSDGVIGVDKQNIIEHFLQDEQIAKDIQMKDTGPAVINGAYLEINPANAKAVKIQRINYIIEIK